MLRQLVPHQNVFFGGVALSSGWLPPFEDAELWFRERRSWLSNHGFRLETESSGLCSVLTGERATPVVAVWSGDLLDEQLFAAHAISLLGQLGRPPQTLLFNCRSTRPRRVRGMSGRYPRELSEIVPYELGAREFSDAQRVWSAVTASTPEPLNVIFKSCPSSDLFSAVPELAGRFPSARDGLDRWESWLLKAFSCSQEDIGSIVASCIAEGQSFSADRMNDEHLLARVSELSDSSTESSLLRLEGEGPLMTARARITVFGEQVLRGELNRLRINTIDRHVGGVLISNEEPWCFDGHAIRRL
jgi:hypothetical protein